MNSQHLKVHPSEKGITLIEFIVSRAKLSRKKAKELIDRRSVFVNAKRIWMARHRLAPQDNVELSLQRAEKPAADRSLILYMDDDYLVVNKPAGIATVGKHSFEEAMQSLFPAENRPREIQKPFPAESSATDTGIKPVLKAAHRLDTDTSGCLLFARNTKSLESVILLFRKHLIKKTYHAMTNGRIKQNELTITKTIDGQTAITHLKVIASNKQASHLLLSIETGRTHQIRKHMAGIHHPILGDQNYAGARRLGQQERQIKRQMLHAARITFTHPSKNYTINCFAPMPEDFCKCLKLFNLK